MAKAEKKEGRIETVVSPLPFFGQVVWKVFRFAMMVCFTFVVLYPLIYMVSMAFRTGKDVLDPSVVWIPRHFSVESFRNVAELSGYFPALRNTLLITIVSSLLQLFTCSLVGYGFARFRFRMKELLFALVIFTIVVPPQMVSLPTYILFQDFDLFGILRAFTGHGSGVSLLNNPVSFFIMAFFGQGIRAGLFILIFRQCYRAMPVELEDAALVDGCGAMRTYWQIMVPNARSMMLVVFLFSLVWYWNDYYMSNIYLTTFPTVSTNLANLNALLEANMHAEEAFDPYKTVTMVQACCVLTLLPLLILYIITQKQFVEGVERTGIVG